MCLPDILLEASKTMFCFTSLCQMYNKKINHVAAYVVLLTMRSSRANQHLTEIAHSKLSPNLQQIKDVLSNLVSCVSKRVLPC